MPKKKTLPRLLNLYPVEVLRERWDIKGTKEEIATEAAENTSRDDIAEFCRAHQGRTKQRILLFDNVSESLAGFGKPLLANQEPAVVSRTAQKLDEFYLFDVSYRAVVGDGSEWKEVHVTFEWPVRVTVDKRIVQLTFTII
ncbi:MAG: hypothetical protein QOF63_3356, partial [Thermoanaerobaculia bacterium]|nr:hypothetical protein [Thermoanaerobaculia bacterium]